MNGRNVNRNKPGFFNTLRWSIGEILGQLLVIPAVVVSAYLGLSYESWWVFLGAVVPLVSVVILITKLLSGKNPHR